MSFKEQIDREAARLVLENEERRLAEVAKEARDRAEAQAAQLESRQREKEAIEALHALLKKLDAKGLLDSINKDVWDNMGNVIEFVHSVKRYPSQEAYTDIVSGVALVSPVYEKKTQVTSPNYDDDLGGSVTHWGMVPFREVAAVMLHSSLALGGNNLSFDYMDDSIEAFDPSDLKDTIVKKRFYFGKTIDFSSASDPILDIKRKMEDDFVKSSAKRIAERNLPKFLVPSPIPVTENPRRQNLIGRIFNS